MGIGELAQRAGVSAPTIRYYEAVGLLRAPMRKASGHRAFQVEDEGRLTFIRRCRAFGFSIEEVRDLVAVTESRERSCYEARDVAEKHLWSLRQTLIELRGLEKSLKAFLQDCEERCEGGAGKDCVVLGEMRRKVRA